MEKVIHRADSRGTAFFGWLNSKHTFSFGRYYDPDRVQFGALRVLNDDIVEPGMGFGTHPHDNMEIISIPLEGQLAHKDSTGREEVINTGEVQIMSAGTGLTHSEYNYSKTSKVNFLQIWILPKKKDIEPRYDQKVFRAEDRNNQLQTVVSPNEHDQALWINQDAWISLLDLSAGKHVPYQVHKPTNGVYTFLISGKVHIDDTPVEKRDGLGVLNSERFDITADEDAQLLFIEVPIN